MPLPLFPEPDNFSIERGLMGRGVFPVAGVDEAGRGPLAGPVVAACVVLPEDCGHAAFRDSKKLTPAARARLFSELTASRALIGVGVSTAAEIDRINILQASLLAMRRAVEDLAAAPAHILVDGRFTIPMDIPQTALVRGEDRSASIAAASIVAKETRDRMMLDLDRRFPAYGFARHKGYPTAMHRRVLAEIGPCPEHRASFRGVSGDCAGAGGEGPARLPAGEGRG